MAVLVRSLSIHNSDINAVGFGQRFQSHQLQWRWIYEPLAEMNRCLMRFGQCSPCQSQRQRVVMELSLSSLLCASSCFAARNEIFCFLIALYSLRNRISDSVADARELP